MKNRFSALALLIVLSCILAACGGAALPDSIQAKLPAIAGEWSGGASVENVRFEVTGKGKDFRQATAYDEVVCFKLFFDVKTANGGSSPAIFSMIASRKGNYWNAGPVNEMQWQEYSCPGDYEYKHY